MPQITYRDPSGQTVTTDLNNAPPQVQTLYSQNYLQPQASLSQTQTSTAATGAEIPAIQANAQKAQIAAKQAGALQDLKADLSKKMTLGSAISKYTALGMSADDVFKQYLAESPWGMPNESPQQLQEKGITPQALGAIGTPGSFMDRYNAKNAITGLRDLQDKFHQTNALSQIENFLGVPIGSGNAAAGYNSARQIFGEHLSSLIPGASGASGSVNDLLNTLPQTGDPREYNPGKADAQFQSVEDQLLQSKGYSPKDLGLPVNSGQARVTGSTKSSPSNGGDLLSSLLSNAGKDVSGMLQGEAQNEQKYGSGFGGALAATAAGFPGMLKEYGDLLSNPIQHAQQHPVNTALDVLGPLLGLKAGMAGSGEGAVADAAETAKPVDPFSSAPGKIQQLFNPAKAKNVIGNIRDTIISNADKAGTTINGDTLANGIRQWAEGAKMSNLPDADAIEQAAKNAETQYAGKTFKPSDLKSIYDNIEKGYTKGGEPRSATASYIDRGVQGVLSNQLEQAAPGFARTSDLFRQTFNAEKSPIRTIGKAAVKNAAGYGLGIAGFDAVKHILGL